MSQSAGGVCGNPIAAGLLIADPQLAAQRRGLAYSFRRASVRVYVISMQSRLYRTWVVMTLVILNGPWLGVRGSESSLPANPPPRGPALWPSATPAEVGLDARSLTRFSDLVRGRGCVVRHGRLVYTWGDASEPGDVASAVKPVFAHFLFKAIESGRVPSFDERVVRWEPRLAELNRELGFKDREITWRQLANQTSCYGVRERPGTAFCYNDWQMALFADLLFENVYGISWKDVDGRVLNPMLTDLLGCEDRPSLSAGAGLARPGRLAISPRDFARFGWLYLNRGQWKGQPLIREDLAVLAVTSPLPATLPRAGRIAAEMLPGQRTLGSQKIPDNQTEHFGSYSWLWWVNGREAGGRYHWDQAPPDTFAALGHGGKRGLVVMPSLNLVASWNDSEIASPAQENEAFGRLARSIAASTGDVEASSSSPREAEATTHPRRFSPSQSKSLESSRLRVLVETDAGGDPDDEQSLIRWLLYANEWEVEGLVANRPRAREGENRNPERTGLGIIRRLLDAYGQCWTNLVQHDARYPSMALLRQRTVAGYDDVEDAVDWIIAVVDREDPRPLWYSDWGTDHGAATNNLRRALDKVQRERGPEGYARFKSRLRLVSSDAFAAHTSSIHPPFVLWVDTFRPEIHRQRWYHRFSALTAQAGGLDLQRDVLNGHGLLGSFYPTNTTHGQKEGDSMTFLYLVPTGMNDPELPHWGSWAGRYGHQTNGLHRAYFWANQQDAWKGTTNRDNTLLRWAADLQNDFRARLDWCVQPRHRANHPPQVQLESPSPRTVLSGEECVFRASGTIDPDGDTLAYEWMFYPEVSSASKPGPYEVQDGGTLLRMRAPSVTVPQALHFILRVTDDGAPPLSRYGRVVCTVLPSVASPMLDALPSGLKAASTPPVSLSTGNGSWRPLLRFEDGRPVTTPAAWVERRQELHSYWETTLGAWPSPKSEPTLEILRSERTNALTLHRVRVSAMADQSMEGWLLVPQGTGPFPAAFIPYYEPETSIGRGQPLRDFALGLARRGFVTLSIGSPGGDARKPELAGASCQPLFYLACVADRCAAVLAGLPYVDAARIGIVGHSYGGKWALFGGAFSERFAAVAVSDPGIVWDEERPNVNYWEPWYLGKETGRERRPGVVTSDHPRTGAYRELVAAGRDLHEVLALVAPRPFLLSGGSEDPPDRWQALRQVQAVNGLLGVNHRVLMTSRAGHDPTEESNEQIYAFFTHFLRP